MRKLAFLLIAGFVGLSAYADDCPGGFCHIRPAGGGDARAKCAGKTEHYDCHYNPAIKAQCEYIYVSSSEPNVLSCVAFECDEDYLLWVRPNGQSQGICHKESDVIKTCKENGQCGSDCECMPNYIPTPRTGKTNGAYQECICVPKQTPVPPVETCETKYAGNPDRIACCKLEEQGLADWMIGKDGVGYCKCKDDNKDFKDGKCVDKGGTTPQKPCEYFFNGFVQCGSIKIYVKKRYPISQKMVEELGLGNCDDVQSRIDNDKARLKELEKKFCADPNRNNYGDLVNDDKEYQDARDRLDAFMRDTELNANVWKNAEGKFNTARLASDLTAGVVLGTVGGIVSANIIKKKQLEKGYDALHCTVGGQKVADWGDEFSVGLRRY